MTRWTYKPGLDGIRALAVLLVFVFHAAPESLPGGFIGVDVFFVLSGFLITALLLHEHEQKGDILLGAFWARRVLRLAPMAVLVLAVSFALFYFLESPFAVQKQANGWIGALLYVSNWVFAFTEADYFAAEATHSPILHYWSLSIEEQVYLLWPILLALILSRREATLQARRYAIFAVALTAGAASLGWALSDPQSPWIYYGTAARLHAPLAGAVLAVAWRQGWVPRSAALLAWPTATALCVLSLLNVEVLTPMVRCALGTALGALLIAAVLAQGPGAGGLVRAPLTVHLGRISYGVYLWHWPALYALERASVSPGWMRVLGGLVVTLALAEATWRGLEQPVHRHRRRWLERPVRVIVAGLAMSVGLACIVWAITPTISSQLQDVGTNGFVPTRACVAGDISACKHHEGGRGAHRVLVIGDSHAAAWTPALEVVAARRGWTLYSHTTPTCSWAWELPLDVRWEEQCLRERASGYGELLDRLQPDLIILTGMRIEGRGVSADRWKGAATAALQRIKERTNAQVWIFEPIPPAPRHVPECLARERDWSVCDWPRAATPLQEERILREIADASDVLVLDLDDLACGTEGDVCLAVVDGLATRPDRGHLSRGWSRALGTKLNELLPRWPIDRAP